MPRVATKTRLHFSDAARAPCPIPDELTRMGVKIFIGVGHETTGATTYSDSDIANLLAWLARDPANHHALLDATSLLGAMPWGADIIRQLMERCCLFTPLQKAIGGISGYYIASFTPVALDLIERNQKQPSWAIPRQLKLAAPADNRKPLTGERSVRIGPFYDPSTDKMLGGVINTYSVLAFAETRFGLLRMERRIGSVAAMNKRSVANRATVEAWVARHPMFEMGVADNTRRGAAVTLLRVADKGITDKALHDRIIAKSKQLLGPDGITHPDGRYEPGLDTARYVNAFPGTPGDYRAWIGGVRDTADIEALLDNLHYAYLRSKVVVIEEELGGGAKTSAPVETAPTAFRNARQSAETIAAIFGALASARNEQNREALLAKYKDLLAGSATTLVSELAALNVRP